MQVIYKDPEGRSGTYHPKLGYIAAGKPFALPDDQAAGYVAAGLLKEVKTEKQKSKKPEVTNNGKSINR